MDKKPKLGSDPLEWIRETIRGQVYFVCIIIIMVV